MIGSIARYSGGAFVSACAPNAKFPWATFFVNLTGCLLIGIIAGILERINAYNLELRLLLITGVLGGYTTFSAFGLETFSLLRTGFIFPAIAYAAGSVVLGVLMVYLGFRIAV